MRLIVCSSRVHQRNMKLRYPDDFVITPSDSAYGVRVTEILDLRDPDISRTGAEQEREDEWWETIQCRVSPAS